MNEVTFSTQNMTDGLSLFGRAFPADNARAVISLVHGLGEHSGRYAEMAGWLNREGISVNLIDLRGHGQSEGKRGVSTDIDLLLDDVAALLDYTHMNTPELPHFLMGHSMGGLLVLTYGLQREPDQLAGIISQAPALAVVKPPPGLQLQVMRFLRPLLPAVTAPNNIDPKDVSKNAAAVNAYVDDPLVHNKISIALGLDLIDTGAWVRAHAEQWQLPLLLLHGEDDALTSCPASVEFAQRVGERCTLETVPGGFHEIHHDPEREDVYRRIALWVKDRL